MTSKEVDATLQSEILSVDDVDNFYRDGYVVLRDFWNRETITSVRSAADSLLTSFNPSTIPRSIFTTDEQQRHSDDYFLNSGENISYFLEAKAIDMKGELLYRKEDCVNKIGHNLHELIPAFRAVSLEDPRIHEICKIFNYKRPVVCQSMHIVKPPRIGGAVRPHVDGAFLYTTPQSVLGFWWPLEKCTIQNGCLWAVPGSHKRLNASTVRRFKRNLNGTGTIFDPIDEGLPFDLTGAVPLEINAGDLVLLHHSLVHYSEANESDTSRHAYSIHIIESGSGVVYEKDNWLQRNNGTVFPALYE